MGPAPGLVEVVQGVAEGREPLQQRPRLGSCPPEAGGPELEHDRRRRSSGQQIPHTVQGRRLGALHVEFHEIHVGRSSTQVVVEPSHPDLDPFPVRLQWVVRAMVTQVLGGPVEGGRPRAVADGQVHRCDVPVPVQTDVPAKEVVVLRIGLEGVDVALGAHPAGQQEREVADVGTEIDDDVAGPYVVHEDMGLEGVVYVA